MKEYLLEEDRVLQELATSQDGGLSAEEVRLRQEKYGPNKLKEG